MGQREAQNWMRSTAVQAVPMRYAAEYTFAGGGLEPGESPEEAACRELEEEFQLRIPRGNPDARRLRLLSVRQTRPIGGVSNIMYNYVAAAEENSWLEALDIDAVNSALARRRAAHQAALDSGHFWAMPKSERELVSPEVREVRWLDLHTAVLQAFTSMNKAFQPVNDFQELEYARLNLLRRDPMFLTMVTLLEVESFPSLGALARYSNQFDATAALRQAQWLWDGDMTPYRMQEVTVSDLARRRLRGMFATAEERAELRAARVREDEEREAARNAGDRRSRL